MKYFPHTFFILLWWHLWWCAVDKTISFNRPQTYLRVGTLFFGLEYLCMKFAIDIKSREKAPVEYIPINMDSLSAIIIS